MLICCSSGIGPNQVCTLFGSQPGSNIVDGSAYIQSGYAMDVADLWRRNFLVLLGFFIFLQVSAL